MMANFVLKWCKTKFCNGYKNINVADRDVTCNDNETESEYLSKSSDETLAENASNCSTDRVFCNKTPTNLLTYPTYESKRYASLRKKNLPSKIEKYERNSVNKLEEGHEFTFTLYDFHGQGRVTKDDIKSLVKNIYKTVGTTVSLPPSGSRTVRVKLFVSDTEEISRRDDESDKSSSNYDCNKITCAYSAINNSCVMSTKHKTSKSNVQKTNSLSENLYANITPYERLLEKNEISTSRKFYSEQNRLKSKKGCELIEAEIENEDHLGKGSPRKIYYQKHELLQIVKANMEKNKLIQHSPSIGNADLSNIERRKKRRSFNKHDSTHHKSYTTSKNNSFIHGYDLCNESSSVQSHSDHYRDIKEYLRKTKFTNSDDIGTDYEKQSLNLSDLGSSHKGKCNHTGNHFSFYDSETDNQVKCEIISNRSSHVFETDEEISTNECT